MVCGQWEVPEWMQSTTDRLSQLKRTRKVAQFSPHAAAAKVMGYSSLYWIDLSSCVGDHRPLNHAPSQNALKPIVPELSVYRPISGAGVHSGRRKKERPDQGVAKEAHHARSRREAWLSSSVSSSRGLVVEVDEAPKEGPASWHNFGCKAKGPDEG